MGERERERLCWNPLLYKLRGGSWADGSGRKVMGDHLDMSMRVSVCSGECVRVCIS